MKAFVQRMITIPRDDQEDELLKLSDSELCSFAGELVDLALTKDFKVFLLGNKANIEKLSIHQKLQDIRRILKQFPEVPNTRLALDRRFSDQRDRMLALIDDINNRRLPKNRFHELLHENLLESDYNDLGDELITTRTFLAFAFPKITAKEDFLEAFREAIGPTQFALYCDTKNILDQNTIVSLEDLYLKNLGNLNESERQSVDEADRVLLKKFLPVKQVTSQIQLNNVNTHNVSSNKSADESHVTGFKTLLEAENIQVTANFVSPLNVELSNKNELNRFVQGKVRELKGKLDALVLMNDASLFDNYVRYTIEDKFENITFAELTNKDKQRITPLIKGFRFQANTAKRFVDDMLNRHRANTTFDYMYETDVPSPNGLTMEEMLVTAYWATSDRANFRNKEVTEKGNFIRLIKQMHDIRRGYDVDYGIDKPDELPPSFPENADSDRNRCLGGSSNSLPWALTNGHSKYNPKLISREYLERELKQIYTRLIEEETLEFQKPDYQEAIKLWNVSGNITGNVASRLQMRFDNEYKDEFIKTYKGYVANDTFNGILERGLEGHTLPVSLQTPLEQANWQAIYEAISSSHLPLLHLDPTGKGCESTLNYLRAIEGNEHLIQNLFKLAVTNMQTDPNARLVLMFLSRSNLPSELKSLEVIKINGKSITLGDIAELSSREFEILCTESAERLINRSILSSGIYENLFPFYARKIGFTHEDLIRRYDCNCLLTPSPLHYAIKHRFKDIAKTILDSVRNSPDIQENLLCVPRGNSELPLTLAVASGQPTIVNNIIENACYVPGLVHRLIEEQGSYALNEGLRRTGKFQEGRTESICALLKYGVKPSLSSLWHKIDSPELKQAIRSKYMSTFIPVIGEGYQYAFRTLFMTSIDESTKYVIRTLIPENCTALFSILVPQGNSDIRVMG